MVGFEWIACVWPEFWKYIIYTSGSVIKIKYNGKITQEKLNKKEIGYEIRATRRDSSFTRELTKEELDNIKVEYL